MRNYANEPFTIRLYHRHLQFHFRQGCENIRHKPGYVGYHKPVFGEKEGRPVLHHRGFGRRYSPIQQMAEESAAHKTLLCHQMQSVPHHHRTVKQVGVWVRLRVTTGDFEDD